MTLPLCNRVFTLIFAMTVLLSGASAQSAHSQDKKKDHPSRIGWGVNVGNIQFYTHSFNFGLAPNVAYRLTESLAAGFMLKLDYYYEKFPEYDNQKFSAFDVGPTAFMRWKPLWTMDGVTPFLQGLFIQAEYERASIARPYLDNNFKVVSVRNPEDYLYLGLGASSGYPFSSFFSIHFNVLDKPESSRIPFSYRLGFTYNY